jgi:hypothetical protein
MNTKTVDEKPNQPQSPAPTEPLDVALAAVSRGETSLNIEYEDVTAEIADDDTWREILEAASAHPCLVEGIVLMDDKGQIVRLHRLELGEPS